MAVKMGALPNLIAGRNVRNRPHPKTTLSAWCCRTIKGLAILRCLYGSKVVLLGVVIGKCETPTTNISQKNGHSILMITCQFVVFNSGNTENSAGSAIAKVELWEPSCEYITAERHCRSASRI